MARRLSRATRMRRTPATSRPWRGVRRGLVRALVRLPRVVREREDAARRAPLAERELRVVVRRILQASGRRHSTSPLSGEVPTGSPCDPLGGGGPWSMVATTPLSGEVPTGSPCDPLGGRAPGAWTPRLRLLCQRYFACGGRSIRRSGAALSGPGRGAPGWDATGAGVPRRRARPGRPRRRGTALDARPRGRHLVPQRA